MHWMPARQAAAYGFALLAATVTTGVLVLIDRNQHIPNISLLYLPPIMAVATYAGTGPSLAAAVVAVLEYDFFLLRPLYTLTVGHAEDLLALITFVVVALLTGQLAAAARARTEAAQRGARESSALLAVTQTLLTGDDTERLLTAIADRIVNVLGVDGCAIYLPNADGRPVPAATAGRVAAGREGEAALQWVCQHGREMGLPLAGGGRLRQFLPLPTPDGIAGVMQVDRRPEAEEQPGANTLFPALAAQVGLVLARARTGEQRRRQEVLEESDRVKTALLSAVSHDLRTPLTSIKTAAGTLRSPNNGLDEDTRHELLDTISQEADRLNRLVGNLLDLSRIEAGVLRPALEWYSVPEVLDTVLPAVRPLLGRRPLVIDVPEDLPLLRIDLVRIEELLYNLCENAARYTPLDARVELRIRHSDAGWRISLADHGPGVPAALRRQVFTRFYRPGGHGDRQPGSGLGLAICQGIAQIHGGEIGVEETPGGGATFVLTLPAGSPVPEGVA